MWTRSELKERAKYALKPMYWKAFAVSLVIAFVTGDGPGGSSSSTRTGDRELDVLIATIILIVGLAFLVFRVFVGFMLEVGGRKFYIDAAQGDVNMGKLGFGFSSGKYLGILKTMFLRGLYNFLWYLLLIVPGIVKSYAYKMVPYILADNPEMSTDQAIELSVKMTDGHKWNIFVLELSFIGWYILGLIVFLIGVIFVQPYPDATYAELYLVLRKNALDRGLVSYAELNLRDPNEGNESDLYTQYNY